MASDDLIAKLDRAAETLIDEAFPASTESGEPAIASVSVALADKIKAFGAVRDWMSDRKKLVPEDRKSGKGEQLRDKFNRTKAPSRRNRAAEAEHSESKNGAAVTTGPVPSGTDTLSADG